MCDQTEVSYLDGDVVWVKIGPIWWPGVVKDLDKEPNGQEILAGLKKKPIAAVKFFEEDNYEFVRNLEHIYHYSCRKKDEFIKKGLDKFRSGAPHMKKFPTDVTTAESLINGDVNIINDPKFQPVEKPNVYDVFGTGKKKTKKDKEIPPRVKSRASTGSVTPYRPITHQRFINKVQYGHSDYEVRTLIQPSESGHDCGSNKYYKCHVCKFETRRVNVIVAHHRLSHSAKTSVTWTGSDGKLVRRKPIHKSRKIKAKKLFEASVDESSEEDVIEAKIKTPSKIKRSPKEKSKSPTKSKEINVSPAKSLSSPAKRKLNDEDEEGDVEDSKKPRFTDVLLADWSEDEDDEEKKAKEKDEDKDEDSQENLGESWNSGDNDDETKSTSGVRKNEKMSCFDFDEEEEGFIGMSNANTYGRKIPRVIPVKDKSDLGLDLEVEELFKRKSESDADDIKSQEENDTESEKPLSEGDKESGEEKRKDDDVDKNQEESLKPEKATKRRRKSSKDQDKKTPGNVEDSLAFRRARRPGAKKSYLNEVIERIDDDENTAAKQVTEKNRPELVKVDDDGLDFETLPKKKSFTRDETSSGSSRRKQDLKIHALDSDREEMVYSELVTNEQTTKKRGRGKRQSESAAPPPPPPPPVNDDLNSQIDSLLAETSVPSLPPILAAGEEKEETTDNFASSNIANLTFDYAPSETIQKKIVGKLDKPKEMSSITRMFSDSQQSLENNQESKTESSDVHFLDEGKGTLSEIQKTGTEVSRENKIPQSPVKTATSSGRKKGPLVLSSLPRTIETSGGPVTVLPIIKTTATSNEGSCVVLPGGKKVDIKKVIADSKHDSSEEGSKEPETPRVIKTFKIKPDTVPTSLLASSKIKGQTIIQQKGGKYVIVPQPAQAVRQKVQPGKIQSPSKVVILTNQHGEQKIITTSGLQQSKFKLDAQKIISSPDPVSEKIVESPSTSGLVAVGKSQPVIKMVPDGKGGIMKQLTVAPKKVLFGSTKVLVSSANATTTGTVQKFAFPANASGGDYRLIENYRGSGKTVLIQGSPNAVLKSSAVAPKQLGNRIVQGQLSLKKPKILMRTSSGQNEIVVQSNAGGSAESPKFMMKRKGSDGNFTGQKIIRRQVVTSKFSPSVSGSKTLFLSSGQTQSPRTESIIIKQSPDSISNKIIRLKQKVRSPEVQTQKVIPRIIQKTAETYNIGQNSLLLTTEQQAEPETPQIMQIQAEQSQQPVLQTQVVAMPGPVGADGNPTYVLVSVDEHGVVQTVDNSIIAYDASSQSDQVFINPASNNNVILINQQNNEEFKPVYSNASQDILAEALANTNVLDGSITSEMEPVLPSILLPTSIPSSVVQETSITLQKPIMTPLEMPSSVAPDTSGLQPPPLPPTPTDEDVLMEEPERELQIAGMTETEMIQQEEPLNETEQMEVSEEGAEEMRNEEYQEYETVEDPDVQSFQETEYQESVEKSDQLDNSGRVLEEDSIDVENTDEAVYYQEDKTASEEFENQPPREDFIIENSQEGQGTNSFQSMPLLNDEPDTSDDAQGSEPIADQDVELQKSRIENGDFSPLLREQEPPSSTNNDIVTESNYENHDRNLEARYETYPTYQDGSNELDKSREYEGMNREDQNARDEEAKDKESSDVKDTQVSPLTADDSNVNSYDVDPAYADVMSQKRFQEETEVTSTTDEFTKDNVV